MQCNAVDTFGAVLRDFLVSVDCHIDSDGICDGADSLESSGDEKSGTCETQVLLDGSSGTGESRGGGGFGWGLRLAVYISIDALDSSG